jgi:alpha-glucosidase
MYQGDELGLAEVDVPPEAQRDPWGLRVPGLGRDGCRTPMPWDAGAGFGFTEGDPWLPPGPEAPTRNVAAQLADPGSILNLYRRLLRLRRDLPSLNRGEYRPVDAPGGVYAYRRESPGERTVTVALNFTEEAVVVDTEPGVVAVSTGMDREGERVDGRAALRGDEGIVVVLDA